MGRLAGELDEFRTSLLRLRAEVASIRLAGATAALAAKAGYDPNQPRVPSGRPTGGQWVRIALALPAGTGRPAGLRRPLFRVNRSRGGPPFRTVGRRQIFLTPRQDAELLAAELASRGAMEQVRRLDPHWKPPASLTAPTTTAEQLIAIHRVTQYAAEARVREIQSAEARVREIEAARIRPPGIGHNHPPPDPPSQQPVLTLVPGRPRPNEVLLVPLGFETPERYRTFVAIGREGLREAGVPDAVLVMRGSAVTGFGYGSGLPFDAGRVSDFGVAIVSAELYEMAIRAGAPMRRTKKIEPGTDVAEALKLDRMLVRLKSTYHRKISIVIYQNYENLINRDPWYEFK